MSDIDTPKEFALSTEERMSSLWRRLKAHFEEKLRAERIENDKWLDEPRTARVRGRISCLKEMIKIGDEPEGDIHAA